MRKIFHYIATIGTGIGALVLASCLTSGPSDVSNQRRLKPVVSGSELEEKIGVLIENNISRQIIREDYEAVKEVSKDSEKPVKKRYDFQEGEGDTEIEVVNTRPVIIPDGVNVVDPNETRYPPVMNKDNKKMKDYTANEGRMIDGFWDEINRDRNRVGDPVCMEWSEDEILDYVRNKGKQGYEDLGRANETFKNGVEPSREKNSKEIDIEARTRMIEEMNRERERELGIDYSNLKTPSPDGSMDFSDDEENVPYDSGVTEPEEPYLDPFMLRTQERVDRERERNPVKKYSDYSLRDRELMDSFWDEVNEETSRYEEAHLRKTGERICVDPVCTSWNMEMVLDYCNNKNKYGSIEEADEIFRERTSREF